MRVPLAQTGAGMNWVPGTAGGATRRAVGPGGDTTCGGPWIPAFAGMTQTFRFNRQPLEASAYGADPHPAP